MKTTTTSNRSTELLVHAIDYQRPPSPIRAVAKGLTAVLTLLFSLVEETFGLLLG